MNLRGNLKRFRYEWITTLDEENSWHLVDARGPAAADCPRNFKAYKGDIASQQLIFEKLLRSIHMDQYIVDSCDQLSQIVKLADYYCALPILSTTLDSALPKSIEFCRKIGDNAGRLLLIATQVRSALLFRECVVFLTGPWHDPDYRYLLEDPEHRALWKICHNAYNGIAAKIVDVDGAIMIQLHGIDKVPSIKDTLVAIKHAVAQNVYRCEEEGGVMHTNFPGYYYQLEASEKFGRWCNPFHELLKTNLRLDPDGRKAGYGPYYGCSFLCAEVDDEDLPWDITETDW